MSDLQELLAHPDRLVSHVETMRADGDFRSAAALLREALRQGAGNSEMRVLLASTQSDLRLQDEERAWIGLLSEARASVEVHVERGELVEAQDVLTRIESEHGAIEALEDSKVQLQRLRRERDLAKLASHLNEAQRLRDEGRLEGAVWEARQALELEPQNHETVALANSLILEVEEQELEIAVRRDAARIGALLGRGRLVRAGLLIRNSQRKYGNLSALQGQLQRRRRLRTTRWAGRWANVSHTAKAPALWIRRRLEERGKARKRVRLALVSETRARIDGLVERGEVADAQTVLARVESQHGAIEELEDLKERLVVLRREEESARLASHLREAERLRDEDQLGDSLGEARQALALDPQDREATTIVDSLIVDIERQELATAARLASTRIDVLLERGRLLRAELRIKSSLRRYGSLPVFRDQLQRCRRLRTTRWAKRRTLTSQTAGAPALWIRQRVEARGKARVRMLIARVREERRAQIALVSETRARVEEHVERGELAEARAALAQVEGRQGAIEELDDWRDYLQTVHAQWESEKLASHLSEARRLRAEDRFEDSLGEARRALTIDPQNGEATYLVDSLVSELEKGELVAAARKDAARIDVLLSQGDLGRAELLIGSCRRKYGDLPSSQHQLRRCRRLRAVRWAGRGAKLQEWVRAVPMDRIRAFPAERVKPRLKDWSKARTPALVASVGLVVLATTGIYLAIVRVQLGSSVPVDDRISAVDSDPASLVAPSGDLILDALPWGRVVAIVDERGEQQDLGDSLFTPVRRSLPAGSYRVVLENPAVEEPAEFWVQIFPSGVTTKVHEFKPFDADAYFGKAWW